MFFYQICCYCYHYISPIPCSHDSMPYKYATKSNSSATIGSAEL